MQWPAQIKMINQVIDFLKGEDLNEMYKKLLPKILHNKDNLDKFIARQQQKNRANKDSPFLVCEWLILM